MIVALLATWATLISTETGTHAGPLHLNETFAEVMQSLGPAPVVKKSCDDRGTCNPTLSYTDGASTVIVSARPSESPNLLRAEYQHVASIEIIHGENAGTAAISKRGVGSVDTWTWESVSVFAPPPRSVPGWKRSASSDKEVEFNKDVCGFTTAAGAAGRLSLDAMKRIDRKGHWIFTLSYIEFMEEC